MNLTKRQKYIALLSIIFMVVSYMFLLIYVKNQVEWQSYKDTLDQKTFELPAPVYKIQQTGDPYLPDNITDNIIETFTDIFWDYNNNSGGGGLLVVGWSYVPGFGSNGNQTIQILFFLFFTGGILYAAEKWG